MLRDDLLPDAAARFFLDRGAPAAVEDPRSEPFDEALWQELEELGFTLVGVPESAGGTGGSWLDTCTIIEAIGRHAIALPVVETSFMAGWLLASAGLSVPAGPVSVCAPATTPRPRLRRSGEQHVLSGDARAVPWGARSSLVVPARDDDGRLTIVVVDAGRAAATPSTNLAGEPRDDLRFDDLEVDGDAVASAPAWMTEGEVVARGALARSVATVGVLDRCCEMTIAYAQDRQQFGRPIIRFQAVADHLAQMARDAALARSAVDLALEALPNDGPLPQLQIAITRVMCAKAAASVARRAHQVHGAIGVTTEYPLHRLTRRLMSWRDEFGTEADWARLVGALAGQDDRSPWELVVSTRPAFAG